MKYSIDYWKRRLQANTQALPPGEQKLLMSSVFETLDKQAALLAGMSQEMEALRVKLERKGSTGASRPSKKLGTQGDRSSDSE